jgi:hypothetical protein
MFESGVAIVCANGTTTQDGQEEASKYKKLSISTMLSKLHPIEF